MSEQNTFTSIYSENFTINFLQCYSNGALKHTELFNLFQMVAANHADSGGIGLSDLRKHQQAWVLSKLLVEFFEMPNWKEEIVITTWIKSLENSKSVRCFEVFCNNKKIIGCESFWVIIDTEKRRPANLALTIDALEVFPEKSAVSMLFERPKVLINSEKKWSKQVVLSDLDIVNHVNNVKYMEWCLDCLDANFVIDYHIKTMEIHFLREMILQDLYTIDLENNSFFVSKNKKVCFVLSIA